MCQIEELHQKDKMEDGIITCKRCCGEDQPSRKLSWTLQAALDEQHYLRAYKPCYELLCLPKNKQASPTKIS